MDTVGSIVLRRRAFEGVRAGGHDRCGGTAPLAEVRRTRGLEPGDVLASLEAAADAGGDDAVDAGATTWTSFAGLMMKEDRFPMVRGVEARATVAAA